MQGIEFIHQWQALGKAHPDLLRDEALANCKKAGMTSLQSYVYWAEIEKKPEDIDFSAYDELVDKLKEHELKWVPFLIMGPHYATPEWFQKSPESVYARCLEHGEETRIQSIWNTNLPKHVDRFIRIFGEHYNDRSVIESIVLGISGNWGEALFPATGGFPPRDFHTHPGWWCGDLYAISDFMRFVRDKYGSIKNLNEGWAKNYQSFDEIEYPKVGPGFFSWLGESTKNLVHFGTKMAVRESTFWDRGLIGSLRLKYPSANDLNDHHRRTHWLDFVQWYVSSMTRWAELWMSTARKHFPETKIYLAVGGDGSSVLGADFSAQAKVAAKYQAGIRVTNQDDDYLRTFVVCRLVSSACRFYGAYFTTEEAWHSSPGGVVARVFDAATSGAAGAYFKDIIGEDIDIAWTKYPKLGGPTDNAPAFERNASHITGEKPVVEAAVVIPNTAVALDPSVLTSIYSKSASLRDVLDFGYVDENMVRDGALRGYRFLVVFEGGLSGKTLKNIGRWIEGGGVLISDTGFQVDVEQILQAPSREPGVNVMKIKQGYWVSPERRDTDLVKLVRAVVYNRDEKYPWNGLPEIDDESDGVYATRFKDRILYFNSTGDTKVKRVAMNNLPEKKEFELKLPPCSIAVKDI